MVQISRIGCPRPTSRAAIKDRLERGVLDGDLAAPPATIDAIARYYTTVVVQGLSDKPATASQATSWNSRHLRQSRR